MRFEELKRWPGVDVDAGLRHASGAIDLYERVLALFVSHHNDESQALAGLHAQGAAAEVRRRIQRLHGSATALGLVGLARATKGYDGEGSLSTVTHELELSLARIASALSSGFGELAGLDGSHRDRAET